MAFLRKLDVIITHSIVEEFLEFSKEWKIKIITSSPYYPKSNGLSEKGVGIAKKLIKKAVHTGADICKALLEYRSTPLARLNYSPSQLAKSRILRTTVPVTTEVLKPKVVKEEVFKRINHGKNEKAMSNYDQTSRARGEFREDEKIWIRDKGTWVKETVNKETEGTKIIPG